MSFVNTRFAYPYGAGTWFQRNVITLNAEDEGFAFILRSAAGITISEFTVFTGWTVTTDGELDGRIETLPTGWWKPTGTLWAANTNKVVSSSGAGAAVTFALTANATIGANTDYAVVVRLQDSGSPPTSFNGQFVNNVGYYPSRGWPRYTTDYGSGWGNTSGEYGVPVAIKDAGGNYPFIVGLMPTYTTTTRNPTTSGHRSGNRFKLTHDCKVAGIWCYAQFNGDSPYLRILQDDDTVLGSVTSQDIDQANGWLYHEFDLSAEVELSANTWYRVCAENPPTGSLSAGTFHDVLHKNNTPSGQNCYCSYYNGTSWTDYTKEVLPMGLIISQVHDTAGGAGGLLVHPGTSGGMQG